MVVTRYETLPDPSKEQYLLAQCVKVQGLMGLVIEILNVETGLAEIDTTNMVDIAEVIWEELERSGLPRSVLFGSSTLLAEYAQVMGSRPALDA